jgi:hypothetical protein
VLWTKPKVGNLLFWFKAPCKHVQIIARSQLTSMVHVNVNVQHAMVVFEQLQNAQHNVVDVAEATGLALLGMVQATRPVDHCVSPAMVEPHLHPPKERIVADNEKLWSQKSRAK